VSVSKHILWVCIQISISLLGYSGLFTLEELSRSHTSKFRGIRQHARCSFQAICVVFFSLQVFAEFAAWWSASWSFVVPFSFVLLALLRVCVVRLQSRLRGLGCFPLWCRLATTFVYYVLTCSCFYLYIYI